MNSQIPWNNETSVTILNDIINYCFQSTVVQNSEALEPQMLPTKMFDFFEVMGDAQQPSPK